jgi:hypothetical protein
MKGTFFSDASAWLKRNRVVVLCVAVFAAVMVQGLLIGM